MNFFISQKTGTPVLGTFSTKEHIFDFGTGYIFHKRIHFLGEWGGKLILGKGIIIVGVKMANLLNLVPIPQKHFRWKYIWNESFFCALCIIWYTDI